VERLAVRSCTRRGPAIDLVLARARENRSQFVIARARGREMIFWQSPRTSKQARPAVAIQAHCLCYARRIRLSRLSFRSRPFTAWPMHWLATGDIIPISRGMCKK
jgi:hypothetical protein